MIYILRQGLRFRTHDRVTVVVIYCYERCYSVHATEYFVHTRSLGHKGKNSRDNRRVKTLPGLTEMRKYPLLRHYFVFS